MRLADENMMKVNPEKILYIDNDCNHKILTRFYNCEMIREYCGDESVGVEDIVSENVLLAAWQYGISKHIFPCMVVCPRCEESIFLVIGDECNSLIPTEKERFEDFLLTGIKDARSRTKPQRSEYRYK